MNITAVLALVLASVAVPAHAAADPLQAFPPAEPGYVRYVIAVPPAKAEADRRVELFVGKSVSVDARNRCFFGGKLERETITGGGYDRYVLRELGPMAGTMIGVDPHAPTVVRFVTLGGEPRLLRYNSRLPVVVCVPDGVEVRYRMWRAEPDAMAAGPR